MASSATSNSRSHRALEPRGRRLDVGEGESDARRCDLAAPNGTGDGIIAEQRGQRDRRPARDLREDEHLAVGADRLEQRILVDLTVDRHGDTFVQVTLERRVELGELAEELPHGRRRELELGDAPRELREVADQHHARHACVRPS
jgi:hypothetical protein